MSHRRKVEVKKTRVAGVGGDGELYGVTHVVSDPGGPGTYRKQVCATCPWRLDAEIGRFPPDAYRESAPTAYDVALTTFACHESGIEHPQTCAGFLRSAAEHNLAVRLAILRGDHDPSDLKTDVPVYDSYAEMAVANGVPADDPAITPCRPWPNERAAHRRRSRATLSPSTGTRTK